MAVLANPAFSCVATPPHTLPWTLRSSCLPLTCCSWWWRPLVGSFSSAFPSWDARLERGTAPEAQSWSCQCALCGGPADSSHIPPKSSGWPLSRPNAEMIHLELLQTLTGRIVWHGSYGIEKRKAKNTTSFSATVEFFLASTVALCMVWISRKSHLSRSVISNLSSSTISWADANTNQITFIPF